MMGEYLKKESTKKQEIKNDSRQKKTFYIFLIAYVLAIIALIIIFRPFLYSIILGVVLGVFFFPLNKILISKGLKPNTSALILVFLIFILILAGSFFFINSIIKETTNLYQLVSQYDFHDADDLVNSVTGLNVSTQQIVSPLLNNINEGLSTSIPNIIGSLTEMVLGLFIMLFLLFYIFKDGENIKKGIMSILPVSKDHKDEIKKESKKIMYSVMYGQFLIAVAQGFLGWLAFVIFGLNNPVFWGFIMATLSFIPMLGTPVVWVPAGILQILDGNLLSGIGLLVYGAVIMFTIENIVRPKIIGKRSGMHPILVLLSIFGGLKLFGIIGLLIGPIVVALCVLVIKFFNQELIRK